LHQHFAIGKAMLLIGRARKSLEVFVEPFHARP
jgi:hypothetical protein